MCSEIDGFGGRSGSRLFAMLLVVAVSAALTTSGVAREIAMAGVKRAETETAKKTNSIRPSMIDHPVTGTIGGRENTEWSESYSFHMTDDNRDLPRILLVGDSITYHYQEELRRLLKGRFVVSYWVSSYSVSRPIFKKYLDICLDDAEYDIIHFNNGLHSLLEDSVEWGSGVERALLHIKAKQPRATIVFATSTPLKDEKKTHKVSELNKVGCQVASRLGIVIDDLYALVDPYDRKIYWRDMYHHTKELSNVEASKVADCVMRMYREYLENGTATGSVNF